MLKIIKMKGVLKTTILLLLLLSASIVATAQMSKADSFFAARNWTMAKRMYESVLKDTTQNSLAWNRLGFTDYSLGMLDEALKCYQTSLSQRIPRALKAIVYLRIAKVHALKNDNPKAFINLDSAVSAGYTNYRELDTIMDFKNLREEKHFKEIRQQVYVSANPCMADPHAREFDFWIGEWDVYQAGTKTYAGHSLVQMIAGGCGILENWDSPNSTGKSINFIDPVTNKWKQSWAGSYANGIQEFVNGEYKDGAMRFTFETTDAKNNKITGRFIFFNEGPNQVRQFNEISTDGGKTWTTDYNYTYIRIK